MSRRKDPATIVIDFFENAPLDSVQTVLGIGKSILKRRQLAAKPPENGHGLTPAQAAGFTTTPPATE